MLEADYAFLCNNHRITQMNYEIIHNKGWIFVMQPYIIQLRENNAPKWKYLKNLQNALFELFIMSSKKRAAYFKIN